MLQDQKIGHYMHVPPRAIFLSQIFGELLGVPINYGIIQWVLRTKADYLTGDKVDPLNQWTGQSLSSYNTMGVQYVLVGPKRLFQQHMYKPLPYAFLYGALAPLILFALHKAFPKSKLKFHLCESDFSQRGRCQEILASSVSTDKPTTTVGPLLTFSRECHHLRYWRFPILRQSVYRIYLSLHCRLRLHVLVLPTSLPDLEALQLPCRCRF